MKTEFERRTEIEEMILENSVYTSIFKDCIFNYQWFMEASDDISETFGNGLLTGSEMALRTVLGIRAFDEQGEKILRDLIIEYYEKANEPRTF